MADQEARILLSALCSSHTFMREYAWVLRRTPGIEKVYTLLEFGFGQEELSPSVSGYIDVWCAEPQLGICWAISIYYEDGLWNLDIRLTRSDREGGYDVRELYDRYLGDVSDLVTVLKAAVEEIPSLNLADLARQPGPDPIRQS